LGLLNRSCQFVLAVALFETVAIGQQQTKFPPGYLTAEETIQVVGVVPPAPGTGDARFEADMAVFRATRSLKGSERWKIAQSDNDLSVAGQLHAFACVLGVALTPEAAPKLAHLLGRANTDTFDAARAVKFHYLHKRPFQVAPGDVCLSAEGKAQLERSPDYPSAHSSFGWNTGLILAELDPKSGDAILARARAYGQSRVVCGVHNLSAVETGWLIGAAIFAMEEASPAFRSDLDAARSELEELRSAGKFKPKGCEVEAAALAKSPY